MDKSETKVGGPTLTTSTGEILVCCCLTGLAWLCLGVSPNHIPEAVRHYSHPNTILFRSPSRSETKFKRSKEDRVGPHFTPRLLDTQYKRVIKIVLPRLKISGAFRSNKAALASTLYYMRVMTVSFWESALAAPFPRPPPLPSLHAATMAWSFTWGPSI